VVTIPNLTEEQAHWIVIHRALGSAIKKGRAGDPLDAVEQAVVRVFAQADTGDPDGWFVPITVESIADKARHAVRHPQSGRFTSGSPSLADPDEAQDVSPATAGLPWRHTGATIRPGGMET
jgi:hypothetical protein